MFHFWQTDILINVPSNIPTCILKAQCLIVKHVEIEWHPCPQLKSLISKWNMKMQHAKNIAAACCDNTGLSGDFLQSKN